MKISQTVFNLLSGHEYMVEMAMCNVQRAITPKVAKSELRFKYHERYQSYRADNNSFQLTEWTLAHDRNVYFQYLQCSMGCNSKGRLTRVMFYMSSHGALHLRDIS